MSAIDPNFAPLVAAPLLVPLVTALLCALMQRQARWLSLAGSVAMFAAALALFLQVQADGTQTMAFGGWQAPFGIAFVADPLGASMALITALMGLACIIFQFSGVDSAPESPTLYPLLHALLAGVAGAFLTGDIFNLYVWFELMLVAAVGLLALGGRRAQLEGAFKYFVLNAFGTMVFLMAIGWIYARTGQLNLQALEIASASLGAGETLAFVAALCIGFLLKAGAFPLFAWLPASYHTLPAPVLALFAGLLTKVGIYAVLRIAGDVFPGVPAIGFEVLGWIAIATMVTGVLGAAFHWDIRRILAFHIVSQIGYMLLGVALDSADGRTGTVFYILHHIIVKANLFLIGALIFRLTGSYDLRESGGLWASRPLFGLLFLVPALSLVGIPPLSGFWAKFIVVREAMLLEHWVWAAVALLVGFLTLYSMMKIWFEAFWKPHPQPERAITGPTSAAALWPAYLVVVSLAALTVAIGLMPEPMLDFARSANAAMEATP